MDVESTYVLGPLLVLYGLFERLGIDEVLKRVQGKHPRLGLSLREAVFSLTVSRFIRPSSKLAVYEHLLGSLYPAMAGAELKLHQLYRTLDVLAAAKDDIEVSLFAHGRDLFTRQVDVVLSGPSASIWRVQREMAVEQGNLSRYLGNGPFGMVHAFCLGLAERGQALVVWHERWCCT